MKTLQPIPEGMLKEAFGAMEHPRDFRPFVPLAKVPPELNTDRRERTAEVMETDLISGVHDEWGALMEAPFQGITMDGTLRDVARPLTANNAPRAEMEAAATALLELCRPEILAGIRFERDAKEWRRWHNMPVQWERDGIGLEEMNGTEREAMHTLMRASLSPEGYEHARQLMQVNLFSGQLIGREKYLNENCFQIGIFGTPGEEIWGWQIYGHHISLSCILVGETYVLSPIFLAAEPTVIDEGPESNINVFVPNEDAGLALIRGLDPEHRSRAITLTSILNDDVPEGRRHWADSLHLGGAFQDNRIIPAEGLVGADMSADDKQRMLNCIETFFMVLPEGPRAARMAEIAGWLDETWLTWMGGYDDWAPFYYRLQSPVVLVEFDHHQAVFLTNTEPARFHVHTIARIPNGGDYGRDLLAQFQSKGQP